MRVFYGLIITAVILMIGACALKAYKKEGALARVVFLYELGAFICGIIFLVYTYVPGTTITVLCKGLIMASFDWLQLKPAWVPLMVIRPIIGVFPFFTDCLFSKHLAIHGLR